MSITQRPTTNFWPNANKPKWIIIHGTAGGSSAIGVAQDFIDSQGSANPKSTHYVIGQDGQIVQCVQEKDAAWGNGVLEAGHDPWWTVNPNLVTISIEHVKPDVNNASALTAAQKQASFTLIRDICNRHGIPKRKADKYGGITGHFSISPIDRAHCPGTYPWTDLFQFLQGDDMLNISDAFASTYFKEIAPDRWQCNNGNAVIGGILDFYRKTGGVLRLPVNGEQYNIPGAVWQRFEGGIAVYDPVGKIDKFHNPYTPCFLLKLDSDLAKAILGIIALQNQLAASGSSPQLQAQLDAANKSLADSVAAKQASDAAAAKAQAAAASATAAAAQALAGKNDAQAQVAELQKQLAAKPDKNAIAADLVAAIQAALSKETL